MDFAFTPEQEAIRETARRFAEDRVAPGYQAREAEARFDRALVREMGELGLIGPELPEDLGGHGLDGVCAGIIIEEIARGDLSMAYTQLLGSLMGSVIALHARPEVARRVVPEIIAGETIVALGLTEPGGGSDAANLKLKARRENEFYVLDGEKTSTSLADQADQIVVFARTGTAAERARGVSAFLIPLDAPGITPSRFEDVGEVVIGRGSLFFDQVRARPEARLGEEGQGFQHIMRGFD